MSKFKIGDLVMIAGRPDRKGLVRNILTQDGGINYYDVTFYDGQTGSYAELQLKAAIFADDPWELFANNQHKGYEEFGLLTTYHKVRNTTNNTLSTLRASRTEFKPFQYKPLVKFLNSPNRRILVADEVGLGKTIEAGHIMLELAGRGDLKNAMIAWPKSLKDKWQVELREKFNFHFKIISSRRELLNDYKHSVSTGEPFRVIVTYGSTRTMTEDRRDLAQENNPFILELQKTDQFFDLLICDEAHYVRNTNLSHRGLRKVAEVSKAVVFLTATPLMTDIDNLYHLLSILDQEMFYDSTVFQNAINLNKPFIRALIRLNNNEDLKDIGNELLNSEIIESVNIGKEYSIDERRLIKEYFNKDPLFNRVIENLKTGKRSPANISSIQKDLTDLNTLNHIYTRSRKREVFTEGEIATRDAHSIFVELTEEERRLYNRVIEEYAHEPLALVTKKRSVSSCIPAHYATEDELKNGNFYADIVDSKFEHLWQIIEEVVIRNDRKLIVFAFFKKTLFYLKTRIEKEGIKCALMYGPTKNRQEVIDDFREKKEIKIFLSSQVGTEGVDLQFCNAIVNYDLPWNPMVVEQRIGRIDRIGQKEEIVHIYTLVLKSTIEAQIHNRLLARINVFRESVGDLESILSEEGSSLEKSISLLQSELYGAKLTEEQRRKKIDDIAIAIENQKRDLELIKEELTDSMVNDTYFQNAINNIIRNQQYITRQDVIFYVRWFLREEFPEILFNKISKELYELTFPKSNQNILLNYMQENLDLINNKEIQTLFLQFKNRTYNNNKLKITFTQKFASENPGVEYVNAYHPLIITITNYIEKRKLHVNQIFQLSIPNTFLLQQDIDINRGDYLMCVYKIVVERTGKNVIKRYEYLHPVVLDANSQNVVFLKEDEARYFFGQTQQHANEINDPVEFNEEIINVLRPKFLEELKKIQDGYQKEENIKLESFKQRSLKQIDQYYQKRIERLQEKIEELDSDDKILPLFRKNLANAISEYEQRKQGVSETKLFIDNALVSISYVQVT